MSSRTGFLLLLSVIVLAVGPIMALAQSHDELDLTAIPLGDGRVSDGPEVGAVWSCIDPPGGGGAQAVGPWIDEDAGTWSLPDKTVEVDGAVAWEGELAITTDGNVRTLATNGVPADHTTGTYPVQPSDDAYDYDRNPNTISERDTTVELPRYPQVGDARCTDMGAVGYLLTGVAIFNAIDLNGLDAVAHEIQDACQGHPEFSGEYHYHSLTECLADTSTGAHSPLVGYALDGFGIHGRYGEDGDPVTNADLDECHGHTHTITWEGQEVEMYHYHATWEFPYTVSCFRGDLAFHDQVDAGEPTGGDVTRLSGAERIATSVAVSAGSFADGLAGGAVLARSDVAADALAGSPLAVAVDGPLLLTTADTLSGATAEELTRTLTPGATVHLLGGTAALADQVAGDVAALGFAVQRHAGADRTETAVLSAEATLAARGTDSPSTILLADGEGFTDALVAGAVAAQRDGVVLLTQGTTPAPGTGTFLDAHPGVRATTIGATAATAHPDLDTVGGTDPVATAVAVAEAWLPDADTVGLATTASFADALSGGADIARRGGPLLLTGTDALPEATAGFLSGRSAAIVYGGTAAVSDAVASEVEALLTR